MDFQPPDPADLGNVYALNGAFLDAVRRQGMRAKRLALLPDGLADGVIAGSSEARDRLCRCPFLLFSLAEGDVRRWRRLFDGPEKREPDLLDPVQTHGAAESGVLLAGLGFLWQLARRRPYAARVVSGASLSWCERLAECTLIDVFRFAQAEPDLLGFRTADNRAFWQRLLVAGVSPEPAIRHAARLSALQTILTECGGRAFRRLPAAACSMPVPRRRAADTSLVSKPKARGYNTPADESATDNKAHQNLRKR